MSGGAQEFLDTNILVYAFSLDPRAVAAQALMGRGCLVGVQSLNEFTNVARRKLGWTWEEVRAALASIRVVCPRILPMDVATHEGALRIAERHGYSVYDSLLIASALSANCAIFWSEDMGDGVRIDGRMQIRDPFRAA